MGHLRGVRDVEPDRRSLGLRPVRRPQHGPGEQLSLIRQWCPLAHAAPQKHATASANHRRVAADNFLPSAGIAIVAAMIAAGMFEYNFGDSEFLMLFLVLVTLPYAAARSAVDDRTA